MLALSEPITQSAVFWGVSPECKGGQSSPAKLIIQNAPEAYHV